MKHLETTGVSEQLQESIRHPLNVVELGIPGLRHFMFKIHASQSYIECVAIPPYTNKRDHKRIIRQYQRAQQMLQEQKGKLYYHGMEHETVIYKVRQSN